MKRKKLALIALAVAALVFVSPALVAEFKYIGSKKSDNYSLPQL